jgi:outer membrane protein TolC
MAYWAAAGAQRVVDLLRDSLENFRQTIEYHENQVREGAIAEADLLRVRLEGDRVAVAFETAQREAQVARVALLREMGQSDFPEVHLTDAMESPAGLPLIDVDAALRARPDLERVRQSVSQAKANLRLQQAGAKPDVEALAGYKHTAGFNTFMWGLQVNLPFSNRNQGNIAAASSEIHAAESNVIVAEARARAEIRAAQLDVESRRQRSADLLSGSLRRAEESVEIARAAYREGGTDLLRLLDAERVHIELEILNARMLAEYRQSLVSLEAALGVTP